MPLTTVWRKIRLAWWICVSHHPKAALPKATWMRSHLFIVKQVYIFFCQKVWYFDLNTILGFISLILLNPINIYTHTLIILKYSNPTQKYLKFWFNKLITLLTERRFSLCFNKLSVFKAINTIHSSHLGLTIPSEIPAFFPPSHLDCKAWTVNSLMLFIFFLSL